MRGACKPNKQQKNAGTGRPGITKVNKINIGSCNLMLTLLTTFEFTPSH